MNHAKDLYLSAEAAMAQSRYADALRDYGAAYELTKDPVLFYKIATANEKAGKCETALIYFRRYLKEAKPSDNFVVLTKQHITACGGTSEDTATPAAGSGSDTGLHPRPGSAAGSASTGSGSAVTDAGSGSAMPLPAAGSGSAAKPDVFKARHRVAWLLIGGSLTAITIGAVLAYSASAAEKDIDDLYIGFNGQPPVYDAKIEARYQELLDQGHRYEKLSWLSFGVAGALAAAAAVRFYFDSRLPSAEITPTVTPTGAGVSATLRF